MVTQAQSYHRVSLAPSPADSRCQARLGSRRRATARTVRPTPAGMVANAACPGIPAASQRPGSRSRTAGTAPGQSARARAGQQSQGRPRPGRSRSGPRCRCTAAAPPAWRCLFVRPRRIHHQHRAGITQLLHDVTAHVVADPVGVPPARDSMCCIPSGVRSPACSAIVQQFSRQLGQQAQHERPGPARGSTRLNRAPARVISSSNVPSQRPAVYAGASGRQKIIASHHKPR